MDTFVASIDKTDYAAYLRVEKHRDGFRIPVDHCTVAGLHSDSIIGSGYTSYMADLYTLMDLDLAECVGNVLHAAEREFGRYIVEHKASEAYVKGFLDTLVARINTVFALNGVLHKRNANEHTMCT